MSRSPMHPTYTARGAHARQRNAEIWRINTGERSRGRLVVEVLKADDAWIPEICLSMPKWDDDGPPVSNYMTRAQARRLIRALEAALQRIE